MQTQANDTPPAPTRPVVRWRRPGDEQGAMVIDELDELGRTVKRGELVSFLTTDDEPASDDLMTARRRDVKAALAALREARTEAVWLMRDGEQQTVAAVVEVTDATGRVVGRWGYLDLQDEPHPETARARAQELQQRLLYGGTVRGTKINAVAAELDELAGFVVSVDDHFDQDGYFIGRGAGFTPAADEAETERLRQVCNDYLRATPEG